MIHTGKFIMMPENESAVFNLDFKKNEIEIQQAQNRTAISLQQIHSYEDYYSAPKGRKLIEKKTKVIHISKNVFNNNDTIEVLIQAAFTGSKEEKYDPFIIDFLLNENGKVKLIGSTYKGTGQGSQPVFAVIDGKAYYGVYDDRNLGDYLYPYQKLNAEPHIMDSGFTNGKIIFRKNTWEYSTQKGTSIEKAIKERADFITKMIGNKKDSIMVNHSIQYYDMDYKPTSIEKIKVKMVTTYNNLDYNERGIRSLIKDLGNCKSIKIIPLLMGYLEDDRSLDLPADDYGNTTIGMLAENQLIKIFNTNPEFFINLSEEHVYRDTLKNWWKNNKHLYN